MPPPPPCTCMGGINLVIPVGLKRGNSQQKRDVLFREDKKLRFHAPLLFNYSAAPGGQKVLGGRKEVSHQTCTANIRVRHPKSDVEKKTPQKRLKNISPPLRLSIRKSFQYVQRGRQKTFSSSAQTKQTKTDCVQKVCVSHHYCLQISFYEDFSILKKKNQTSNLVVPPRATTTTSSVPWSGLRRRQKSRQVFPPPFLSSSLSLSVPRPREQWMGCGRRGSLTGY